MAVAVPACSFCAKPAAEAEQLFENEDKSAAVCSACVAMFAQHLTDDAEAG